MTVRRMKYRLYRRCRANRLPIAKGFRWRTNKVGKPCVTTLKTYQKFVGIGPTGEFDRRTMDALFPAQFRHRIAALARQEVGVAETSPNWGPRIKQYLAAAGITFPTAYCAAFCVFLLHKAGYRGDLPKLLGWVPSWAEWARKTGRAIAKVLARKGDFVCINWPGTDATPDHIAVVTGNLGVLKRLTTIGANESDAVREAWRPFSQAHTVIRVDRYRRR
jgi:hypothetical protein